jgi:hypothetical protein
MKVYSGDAAILASIINLVDDTPIELLAISGADYTGLVVGLESMGAAIDRWNHRGGDDPPRTYDGKSPVYLVRDALSKCPDERPAPGTTELVFITDGVSAFWAIDDTTELNGSTEVIPGSHLWDEQIVEGATRPADFTSKTTPNTDRDPGNRPDYGPQPTPEVVDDRTVKQ